MTKLARILGVVMLLVLVAAGPALAARKQPDLQVAHPRDRDGRDGGR